jgi:hypothetical protein
MLGKQWLNRYMSTDMRGTAIERSQNRQQKLSGIVTWCFDYVMESLPLMLQGALFLLGCALSRYLWEIDTTVASVILGVTSLGILFYLFIVIAGSVFASCPYQTPGSRILRSAVTSAYRHAFRDSATVGVFKSNADYFHWWSWDFLRDVLCELPPALASDGAHLWQTIIQQLVALVHQVYTWLPGTPSAPTHGMDQQTTLLDLHCTSWILQTSLDKNHHLSAMEHLVTISTLPNFDSSLVVGCFGTFISSVKVIDGTIMVMQGLERLASLSAICLFYTFSHLSVMAPSSGVLVDVCQQYVRIFPPNIRFDGLPFHHIIGAVHFTLYQRQWRHQDQGVHRRRVQQVQWRDYKLSNQEDIIFIHTLTKLAQSVYQKKKKVPCWILRFVLHTLSIDSLPSTLVIVNCLSIIATSLDCDIEEIRKVTQDERYAHV